MKHEPYILPAQLSPFDRACKWLSIAFGCVLVAWWIWPSLIPVRFGRWLFVALGLMSGCSMTDLTLREHEEKHCQGYVHQDEPEDGQPFIYEWRKVLPESAKPWFYVRVDDTDATCRAAGSQAPQRKRINACSIWKPAGCKIYLPR